MIRPAVPADVPAIRRLVEEAYAHYVPRIGMRPLPMDDDYEARVADGQAFVLGAPELQGLVVLVSAADHLYVDNVAVAPACQGRGYGKLLLAFAEERARAAGLRELRLHTNELMVENRALYARLGWVETGRRTIEGRHAVLMRKALD